MMENDPKNDLEKDGGGQMHMVSRKKVYISLQKNGRKCKIKNRSFSLLFS